MRFSLVTPAYNSGRFLRQTVESVLAAGGSGVEVEYEVRDNCSTDDTEKILEDYPCQVRFIREKDGGQANAVNRGWKDSTGDWLAWLNADDLYEPGTLAEVAACARAHPEARWIVGGFRIIDVAGRNIGGLHSGYKNFLLRRYSYKLLLTENIIPQMSVFIRRDLWEEAGTLREDDPLAFDYEYWLRLGAIASPVIVPRVLSAFRWHAGSQTDRGLVRQFACELEYARSYASGRHPWLMRWHWVNYWKTRFFYRLVKAF